MTEYVQHQHVPQPPDSVNVLRFIDPALWPSIKAYTCTTDLRASIQAAIDFCAAIGIATLWFPFGFYPVNVASQALRVTTGKITLAGPKGAVIRAQSSSLGNSDYGGIIRFISTVECGIRGLTVERDTTFAAGLGDGIVLTSTKHTVIEDVTIGNTKGILWKYANSASASTDIITGPGGTSTILNNNDRIEFFLDGQSGSALPAPLTPFKGYFVVNKSGNTFQVALTPGGAAINLTTNGSGTWGFHRFSCTWEASDPTNDTLQITGHPFLVGHRVIFTNTANLGTVSNMPTFVNRGVTYWVVAVPDADHIQISDTPGGAPLDVTTSAGHSLKPQITLMYAPIAGGGNLYCHLRRLITPVCVTGFRIIPGEGGAGEYYGINGGEVTECVLGANHTFHGDHTVERCLFEGFPLPSNESIIRCASGHVKLSGCYTEIGPGPSQPTIGALIEGQADVMGCSIYGTGSGDIGSIGVCLRGNTDVCGFIAGNLIANYDYDIAQLIEFTNTDNGESDFVFFGNRVGNCNRSSLVASDMKTGTDAVHRIQHARGIGYQFGGTLVGELRQTANNPTSLELGLGNARSIAANTAHTVNAITTNGVSGTAGAKGAIFVLIAETAFTTLGTGGFITPSGGDWKMAAGDALVCVADDSGKLRIVAPLGGIVAGTPTALQGALTGSVALQDLFSAAPTPGDYEVIVYVRVGTAATSGTLQIALAYNDGSARSEAMYHINTTTLAPVKDLPVGATGGFQLVSLPIKVASGTPQISATFTGTAGPLSYTTDVAVRRIK